MNIVTPRDIADKLALKKYPRSWRGDCPSCGYPRAFALKSGRTGLASIFCSNGCERESLTETVEKVMGGELAPTKPKYDETTIISKATRQEAALRLWGTALSLDREAAAPGVAYLHARGIEYLRHSLALRFRSDTRHPEGGALAALIAVVCDATRRPTAVHRTFLTKDGSAKAKVVPQKASLGPVWGGAVRLVEASERFPLVIGEGIESSAAAGLVMGLPAWASLSAGNLAAGLVLPPEVRRIVIAADNDLAVRTGQRPGQDAAEAAARRWRREGRHVEIATPDEPVSDFADVLQGHPHGR